MIDTRRLDRILLMAAIFLVAVAPVGQARATVQVLYRAADVVYLDAGYADGLAVGQRLSTDLADLAVTHLAKHTAACRVVRESLAVRPGDAVTRRLASLTLPLAAIRPIALAASYDGAETSDLREPYSPILGSAASALYRARLDGSISFDWEIFRGNGGRDFERRVTRLNLRARGLGDDPHEVRLRMSGRSYGSSSQDRIYEAAFLRRAEDGAFNYSLGRLAGGPRIGYGPLDGSLLELVLPGGLAMGGFYGSSSELDALAFDSDSRRYGVFLELLNPAWTRDRTVEARLSGIREEVLGQASRDYFSFDTRLGATDGRWSLHQRAELDINTGWRYEMSERHVQLSNLSLRLARRFGDTRRMSISYDRFQLYRTYETRWLDSQFFDDRPRQALRANFSFAGRQGWRMALGAGVRSREGDDDRSYSFTARARSVELTPWRLGLSADLLVFSNPLTDGYTTRLRATRPFGDHRRLYLDLGRREWRPRLEEAARSAHWLRLGTDVDLGRSLSVRGEYELSSGDALAGNRLLLGVRYRIRSHP